MDRPRATFEMTVESLTRVAGRGVMFVGHIRTGSLAVGDRIQVISPARPRMVEVAGIAEMPGRSLVQSADAGAEVGVLIAGFDLDEPHPGIQRVEGQLVPVDLILRG